MIDRFVQFLSRFFRLSSALLLALLIVPPVGAGVAVATLTKAPLPGGKLPDEKPAVVAAASVVLDAAGNEIGLFRGFDRTIEISADEIPQVMKDALVAIEDQRFWTHDGVDVEGVVRAARSNLEAGGVAEGGSTLTQQYVKNVYLNSEQTIERKVREALLATELEKRLSKEEIMFGYLESAYFGAGAYGIGAAAEVYFGKSVTDLDASEAATLAGVVKAPTRLSPRVDIAAAEERRRLVLQAMLDQGYLDFEDHAEAGSRILRHATELDGSTAPATIVQPPPPKGATQFPFFVDWVEAKLVERLGPDLVYTGGLRVETTIDPNLQIAAEAAVAERLENTEFPVEMATVTVDHKTGHVKSLVGGRDYAFSQVNLADGGTTGFQPGSSFKPLVLAEAFRIGMGPETVYPAPGSWLVPGCSGEQCTISNYDLSGYGNISLRDAMRASVNTVFAQLITDVSIANTVDMARKLGLQRLDPKGTYGASLSLGAAETSPIEMASAYGTFANRGIRIEPTGILRVTDADGNVLIDNLQPAGEQVLSEAVADNMSSVLRTVVESGTGKRAQIGRPLAGKTGTAQAYRAAWFVGYTPDLTTAVWMGHADKLDSLRNINGVRNVTGGSHPAAAFSQIMKSAHDGKEVIDFPEPAPLAVIVEDAEDVVFRVRETTEAGERQDIGAISSDCGGGPCAVGEVTPPNLAYAPPITAAPATAAPATAKPATATPNTAATRRATPSTAQSQTTPTVRQPSSTNNSNRSRRNSTTSPRSQTTRSERGSQPR